MNHLKFFLFTALCALSVSLGPQAKGQKGSYMPNIYHYDASAGNGYMADINAEVTLITELSPQFI